MPSDRFSDDHRFEKPNDKRALDLMDRAARAVMDSLPDVVMAFGESDEYRCDIAHHHLIPCANPFSFLIQRTAQLYSRRSR